MASKPGPLLPGQVWLLRAPAFWLLNIGLGAMVFGSLRPAAIHQAWHSISSGF